MWHHKWNMRLGLTELNVKANFVIDLLCDLEKTLKISVAQFPHL